MCVYIYVYMYTYIHTCILCVHVCIRMPCQDFLGWDEDAEERLEKRAAAEGRAPLLCDNNDIVVLGMIAVYNNHTNDANNNHSIIILRMVSCQKIIRGNWPSPWEL